jgi:threonine dehydrogenase-like Zn-dependent dehydrogenase
MSSPGILRGQLKTLQFQKGSCQLVETSAPQPGPGQVLVRLRGAIIDETHLADYRSGDLQAPYLVSGEVLQPGQRVIEFRRGQPIVTVVSQPLCQYLVVEESALIPVEQNRAASCLLLGIAMALKAVPAGERYPESTVIGGAGFVGLTLSAILPTTTPWVFGTSDQALMCARDLGASHCKEWGVAVEELELQNTLERGYGAVLIETTGRLQERSWSQHLTLKGGTIVCAMANGPGGGAMDIDATRFHYDQITWESLGPCNVDEVRAATAQLDKIPDTVITDQVNFSEIEDVFEELDKERAICYLMTDDTEN